MCILKKLNKEQFIKDANIKHGEGKYNYSRVIFINVDIKVEIGCNKCGVWFWQTPTNHKKGNNCPNCANNKKLNKDQFIRAANIIHNFKYDYSQFILIDSKTNGIIICKEHGEFKKRPDAHIKQNQGCPKCSLIKKNNDFVSSFQLLFIEQANLIHNFKYDYSKSIFIGHDIKVEIICSIHNSFFQLPRKHLEGHGCRECAIDLRANLKRFNIKLFTDYADKKHNFRYDYSRFVYTDYITKGIIICYKHGEFLQTPSQHLKGSECPSCSKRISKVETEWLDFLKIPKNNRQIMIYTEFGNYIVDGFNQDTKTIFEMNGDYWHGNPKIYKLNDIHPIINITFGELYNKTLIKKNNLEKAGYKVIDIWELDWKQFKKRGYI